MNQLANQRVNQTGNLLGFQVANQAVNLLSREIPSRPVPGQDRTRPSGPYTFKEKNRLNGNVSSLQSEVKGRRAPKRAHPGNRPAPGTGGRMTPQHMNALNEANRVRLARCKLHREVHALPSEEARALLADIISEPPDYVVKARVADVLDWLPKVGPTRALATLRAAGVVSTRTVGELTDRQRVDLGRCLRGLEEVVARECEERQLWMAANQGHAA